MFRLAWVACYSTSYFTYHMKTVRRDEWQNDDGGCATDHWEISSLVNCVVRIAAPYIQSIGVIVTPWCPHFICDIFTQLHTVIAREHKSIVKLFFHPNSYFSPPCPIRVSVEWVISFPNIVFGFRHISISNHHVIRILWLKFSKCLRPVFTPF